MLSNKIPNTRANIKIATIPRWLSLSANTSAEDAPIGSLMKESKNFRIEQDRLTSRKGTSNFGEASSGRVGGLGSFPNTTLDTIIKQNGTAIELYINDSWHEIPSTRVAVDYANFEVYNGSEDYCFIMDGLNNLAIVQPQSITFASAPTAGDTSEALSGNWTGTTGDYPVTFSTGEFRTCTLTNGATSCTWTTALPTGTYATTGNSTFDYSEPSTGIANFKPKFGKIYLDQLFVAGHGSKNVYYWSDVAIDANPEKIYTFTGGAAGNAALKQEIRGLALVDDSILIGLEKDFIAINSFTDANTPIPRPLNAGTGLKNDRLIVSGDTIALYMSTGGKIRTISPASARTGLENKDLSNDIDDLTLEFADNQDLAWGYFYPPKRQFRFNIIKAGQSQPSIRLIYDLRDTAKGRTGFLRDEKAYSAGVVHNDISYIGDAYSGQVYIDEDGLADKGDNDIEFLAVTNKENLELPSIRKTFRQARFTGKRRLGTTIDIEAYVDGALAGDFTISDDTPVTVTPTAGGIGVGMVGDEIIGDASEAEGITPDITLTPFVAILTMRARGYDIQFKIKNIGTAQEFEFNKNPQIRYAVEGQDPITSKDN